MPRRAQIHYVSLKSSLVNLPISIYGPMLERNVRPQALAIHLTVVSGRNVKTEAYVGWTGMASASSLAHFNSSGPEERGMETIELDPQYAQGLGLGEGDIVEIGLFHDLRIAKSVGTEPLTSDDWEIIEIHASHVESTLLSQVRVAKVGQEIDVWVLGRTRVRLKVALLTKVSLDPDVRGGALLLGTDTEVSIAPKIRKAQASGKKPQPDGRAAPVSTSQTSSQAQKSASADHPRYTLSNDHAQILRTLPSKFVSVPLPSTSNTQLYAYVSSQTFSKLQPSHPIIREGKSTIYYNHIIKRLLPPSDPLAATSGSPDSPSGDHVGPKVLKASAAEQGTQPDKKEEETDTIFSIGWCHDLPEGHIVFPVLTEGIIGWDLVRVIPLANNDPIHVESNSISWSEASPNEKAPLAGIDEILSKAIELCTQEFSLQATVDVVRGAKGLLVTGRSGAGKTSIVKEIAKSLEHDSRIHAYIHYNDLSRLTEQPIPKLSQLFHYWYSAAVWHRPSVVVLDNIDRLLAAEVEHADSFRARQLAELFRYLFSPNARTESPNMKGIIILATASSAAALHPLISGAHIFQEILNVKPPGKEARKQILQKIVEQRLESSKNIQQDPQHPLNFAAVATQTEGYSALDLQDLVSRSIHQVAMRLTSNPEGSETTVPRLTNQDFAAAQQDFVPLALRDVKLQKSDVAWNDIGGLKETKRILRETLEWPTKYPPIFAQSPLRLRSGLLLYGYPGCGKTLLASAVAKECGLNFISVKGPEILNKYIGASEKSVRDLFERASAAKPCILFFDEFDSIAPKRGHDSTGVTDRVVNQMLTQMDGAEGLDGVYVLAATSRPDLIDSALLRPGRLDKSVLCNMPDDEERIDILRAVGQKVAFSPDIDLAEVAAATEGYSGADLQALVYNAHLEVIHSSITSKESNGAPGIVSTSSNTEAPPVEYKSFGGKEGSTTVTRTKAEEMALQKRLQQIRASKLGNTKASRIARAVPEKREITQEDLRRVLTTTRPSVAVEERWRLERIYQAFVSDRGGEGMPQPPDTGGIGNRATLA